LLSNDWFKELFRKEGRTASMTLKQNKK